MLSPMFIRAQCLNDLDVRIDDAFDTAECNHNTPLRTPYICDGKDNKEYKQVMYDLFFTWCGC